MLIDGFSQNEFNERVERARLFGKGALDIPEPRHCLMKAVCKLTAAETLCSIVQQ